MNRLLLLLGVAATASATPVVLYDASLGQTPGNSGWVRYAPGASESMGAGYVDFSTLALNALQGGYTRGVAWGPSFRLRFDLRMVDESHASADRSGFSVIALDNEAHGIELGFWEDQVWAQNLGFAHGDSAAFNTTSAISRYDLFFGGGAYRLEINGVDRLSGGLLDYGRPPYDVVNSVFLGDDTTSAAGRIQLAYVEYENLPEPAAVSLVAIGAGLLWMRVWRR